MAITRPRDNIATVAGSASPACSFGSLPSAGSCIVFGVASWKTSAHTHNSVADNQGGTYTQIGTTLGVAGGGGQIRLSLWKRDNISSPSGTFTVTLTASATCDARIIIAEYAGMATSTLDQSNTGTGTGTTASAALSATANADDVIVGLLTTNQAGTASMTEDGTNLPTLVRENEDNSANQAINMAQRVVSSTGTYTGSWAVGSSDWLCVVAALKGAAAATKAHPPRRQPVRIWSRVARW